MSLLNVAVYGAFITALVALPFFLVGGVRFMRQTSTTNTALSNSRLKGMPLISGLLVVVPLLAVAIYVANVKESDRRDVVTSVRSLPIDSIVLVDGKPAANSRAILDALKAVRPVGAHHSHPIKVLQIEIRAPAGSMSLSLGRDSQFPREYWVLYNPQFTDAGIGRIETSELDAY